MLRIANQGDILRRPSGLARDLALMSFLESFSGTGDDDDNVFYQHGFPGRKQKR